MIFVGTSLWVDHLHHGDAQLTGLLEEAAVLMHPFVVGEIACGNLGVRSSVLELLASLPSAVVAHSDEVLGFIERHGLHGKGIGYVDVHLLASVALTDQTKLWTRDKRLRTVADDRGYAHSNAKAH